MPVVTQFKDRSTLEKSNFSSHKKAVFCVCQALSKAGLYGRCDHIGHHPFNSASHRLTIDSVRPDIKLQIGKDTVVVEVVCKNPLRGDRLRRALRLYNKKRYLSIILCRETEREALETALLINDIRVDYIATTLDKCIIYITALQSDITNTAKNPGQEPQNEP